MKKKKLLQIPPIPLRGGRKNYYRMVADVQAIDGENHLICDIYERDVDGKEYDYKMRAAYTIHDWALYFPESGEWSRSSIRNGYGQPVYDQCGMITGPGIPKYPSWKNTALDDESVNLIIEFSKPYKTVYRNEGWNDYLIDLETGIKHDKARKEAAGRAEKLRQRMADMPEVPANFVEWADEKLYFNREFIYYKRKGRWAECTCSACGAKYKILTKRSESFEGMFEDVHPVPANDEKTTCLHCGKEATYKPIGRMKPGFHGNIEAAYLLQPFRGDGTVIRYWHMHKEYSTTEPSRVFGIEIARVFYEDGKKVRTDWQLHDCMKAKDEWCDHNIGGMYNLSMKPGEIYTDNVAEWSKCRVLRYSGFKEYMELKGDSDLRPGWYLNTAERYPIEKLAKMGLIKLVDDVIESEHLRRDKAIKCPYANKTGRLLGIRPCRLSLLQEMEGNVTLFRILQAEKENTEDVIDGICVGKGAWTDQQIAKLFNLGVEKASLLQTLKYMSVTKFLNRVEKYCGGTIPDVIEGWESSCRAQHYSETAKLYMDYIRIREENDFGLERATDQAPRDIRAAHRELIRALNEAANDKRAKECDKRFDKIKKRYRKLKQKYSWRHGSLLIRPAKNAREIIEEGQFLHHCVGNGNFYIEKHNDGRSFILFLRFADNPNQPYITVEVDGKANRICQWYGRNDTKPDKENMELWLSEWLQEVDARKQRLEEAAASATAPASADTENILVAAG